MAYYPFTKQAKEQYQIRLTSSYGMRKDPINGTYKLHGGGDYAPIIVSKDIPIIACVDGAVTYVTVTAAGIHKGLKYSILAGNDKRKYFCMHLDRFVGGPRTVKAGEVIGYMGTTGHSTGVHVHFEIKTQAGLKLDPEKQGLTYYSNSPIIKYNMAKLQYKLKLKSINTSNLNVRELPTSDSKDIGDVLPNTHWETDIVSQGQMVDGNDTWYAKDNGWVTGKYVQEMKADCSLVQAQLDKSIALNKAMQTDMVSINSTSKKYLI